MAFAFPSVGVNTGALRPGVLQRISLFRTGAAGTQSMELSPIVKVPTRQGFYHYFAENDALTGGDYSPVAATGAQEGAAIDPAFAGMVMMIGNLAIEVESIDGVAQQRGRP